MVIASRVAIFGSNDEYFFPKLLHDREYRCASYE